MTQIALLVITCILSLLASIISGLVILNLRTLAKSMASLEVRQDRLEVSQSAIANHKTECQKDFVGKVDFIRAVTSLELKMTKLIETTSEMKGGSRVSEELPRIIAGVVREVMKEVMS